MDNIELAVQNFLKLNEFSKPSADILEKILLSPNVKLSLQLRALYFCRDLHIEDASRILKEALNVHYDAFLRHEIAYVIGQSGCKGALDVLVQLLEDEREDPMVRHEAAEAIAAIGSQEYVNVIAKYLEDESVVVRDTCRLAHHSLTNGAIDTLCSCLPISTCMDAPISSSAYRAVDPVHCSSNEFNGQDLQSLSRVLNDESAELYKRYMALFILRNNKSDEDAVLIGQAMLSDRVSEVFRHECAFVLGQMQLLSGVEALKESLRNPREEPIVRHEAALALGACATACSDNIAREAIIALLQKYVDDPIKVVSDSCIVALDVIEEGTAAA